jgi:hypothetical protein
VGSTEPTITGRNTRPRRVLLGVAIAATVIAIVAVAVLLIRDPQEAAGDNGPSVAELEQLRTEAAAAAVNVLKQIDEADRTGNPALLEGLYTPDNALEDEQQEIVRTRVEEDGEVVDSRTRTSDVRVVKADRATAEVHVLYTVIENVYRDAKTRKVTAREKGTAVECTLLLRRLDNRWLVESLDYEERP